MHKTLDIGASHLADKIQKVEGARPPKDPNHIQGDPPEKHEFTDRSTSNKRKASYQIGLVQSDV